MSINEYYDKLRRLKYAKEYVEDINLLNDAYLHFNPDNAKQVITYISSKYENGINEIGDLSTKQYVLTGTYAELYATETDESIKDQLLYLIECVVGIASVKFRFESTLEDFLKNIK